MAQMMGPFDLETATMATLAQTLANQANARKSTGPRTAEGKEIARRNALKHGLAAEKLVLPEEEAGEIASRVEAWTPGFKPRDDREAWLVEEAAVSSLRIERCRDHDSALRARSAARASLCWEDDRREQVEVLGATLSKSPSLVAAKLRRTKHGCEWLVARWEGLRDALELQGDWDVAQKRIAMDLLGTPRELRTGDLPIRGDKKSLVAAQVAKLERARAEAFDELDEFERAAAEVGVSLEIDKALTLARRYEAANVRRMERALKQLGNKGRPSEHRAPTTAPSPAAREAAELDRLSRMLEREATPPPASPTPTPSPSPASITPPAPSRPIEPVRPAAPAVENRRTRRARKAMTRRS